MKAAWEKLIGKEVVVTLVEGDVLHGILQKNIIKRVEFLTLWALEGDVYDLVAQFKPSEISTMVLA